MKMYRINPNHAERNQENISRSQPNSEARHAPSVFVNPSGTQAILQAVTCCVFLSASAHTVLLMVCTGKKYTLAWYDPLFSVGFTVTGLVLLYVTIADAVLIALRLENVHKAGYWCFVIFGMLMPMFLAGPLTVLQMLLHTFASKDDLIEVEENIRRAGSGDG